MVDLHPYTPMPGDWFYASRCPECDTILPFGLDTDDGQGSHQFHSTPGWIIMTCVQGHTTRHRATELLRLRAQPA